MKSDDLQLILRGIVRQILKEYATLSTSDLKTLAAQDPNMNVDTPPEDAMTSAEKAKMERDTEHERQVNIKQKQGELDAKKKEMEFNKKKLDQQRRFDVPNVAKDLQKLKGAQI